MFGLFTTKFKIRELNTIEMMFELSELKGFKIEGYEHLENRGLYLAIFENNHAALVTDKYIHTDGYGEKTIKFKDLMSYEGILIRNGNKGLVYASKDLSERDMKDFFEINYQVIVH